MREVSEKEKQEYRIPELHMGHYSQVYFPKNTEEAKEALRNSNKRNVTVIGKGLTKYGILCMDLIPEKRFLQCLLKQIILKHY